LMIGAAGRHLSRLEKSLHALGQFLKIHAATPSARAAGSCWVRNTRQSA
jgi:hypothetical protein